MGRVGLAAVLTAALVFTGTPVPGFHLAAQAASFPSGSTTRVSLTAAGTQSSGTTIGAVISSDGRWIAFVAQATDFVSAPVSGLDVYLRDLVTGQVILASPAMGGAAPNGASSQPNISGDGRFVVFSSQASNLVAGDTNSLVDSFVFDRDTGTVTRVSVSSTGAQGNGTSTSPTISSDGRLVAFDSVATNLVPGDAAGFMDVFVHDRQTGETSRISVAADGSEPDDNSGTSIIAGNGRFVAFRSEASDLLSPPVPANHIARVYVRDRETNATTLASIGHDGTPENFWGTVTRSISDDGRFVAFETRAKLHPDDVGLFDADLFVRDTVDGVTHFGSYSTNAQDFVASAGSLSADGRFFAFHSNDPDIVPGDANGATDVFVRDLQLHTSRIASVSTDGTQGNSSSSLARITGDGQRVVFISFATNLVADDTNNRRDAYLHEFSDDTEEAPDVLNASFGDDPTVGISIAEPVNSFTGNLTLTARDLRLASRGPPPELARTYNSGDSRAGAFGVGWSSILDMGITERGSDVIVTRADGRRDVFRRNADGTYSAPPGVFETLTRPAGWTLVTHEQLRYEFSATGLLTQLSDRNDNTLAFVRDGGRITRIEASGGASIVITYASSGTATSALDTSGRHIEYAYATDGHLASATDPTGATTSYGYDTDGRLATVTDALANVVLTNSYDASGRVGAQRDGAGATTSFAYDTTTRTTTITDARGAATTIAHDEGGRATRIEDPAGAAVVFTFDARGNQTSLRDRNGNLWSFTYDDRGNRTGVVDPASGTAVFTYDAFNNLSSRTDPNGNTWRYTYDARGNALTVVDPEDGVTEATVDAAGLPTSHTDPDGFATSYTYDAQGNVIEAMSATGTTRFAYDAAGRAVLLTDPNGHATAYAYDGADRLLRATDALGAATVFTYDAAGRLATATDPRGARTFFTFDGAGRLVRVVDALGQTTTFAYDGNGNRTEIGDPAGNTLRFGYDARDRVVSMTDPFGSVARLAYDANGNVVSTTDARGVNSSYGYDFRNLRTSTTDRAGGITRFTYDAAGQMVSLTEPVGAVTSFEYDRADRYLASTDALGGTVRFGLTAAGRQASRTDAKGNVTTYAYDESGRLANLVDATGGQVRFTYDAAGNLVARTDQLGRTTSYRYDDVDRRVATVDALGASTLVGYDAAGAVTALTDPNGKTTSYTYDAAGQLTQVTDPLGGTTRYAYDARGLLNTLTDANGRSQARAYDANRRLIRHTDALGRTRTYGYDANGNLSEITDAKGQRTALTYDAEDRIAAIAYADGTSVAYTRDAAGQRLRMVDALGTTTYGYDILGRPTTVTDPLGHTVGYAYDANGLRTALTYPDGRAANYTYDTLDRLVSVGVGSDTTRYTYDAAGNPLSIAFANGTRSDTSYDALDRTVAITNVDATGRAASAFAYTYDAAGNILTERVTGARGLDEQRNYQYDARSRLVAAADRGKSTAFTYDAVGNRTSVHRDDSLPELAVFDAADQLTSMTRGGVTTAANTYDANGNLVESQGPDGITRFTYDADDRLVGVQLADGARTTYAYDGEGNLLREGHTTSHAGVRNLDYVLDLAGSLSQILAVTDGRDQVDFLYGLQRLAALGSETRYYGTDVRGSVRSTTDAQGHVSGVRGYDAWGVPVGANASGNTEGNAGLSELFGFTGERQDSRSGLIHLRARWYDPASGRFLTPDAFAGVIAAPQTLHRYQYAGANPVSYVDRTGYSPSDLVNGDPGYSVDMAKLYKGWRSDLPPAEKEWEKPAPVDCLNYCNKDTLLSLDGQRALLLPAKTGLTFPLPGLRAGPFGGWVVAMADDPTADGAGSDAPRGKSDGPAGPSGGGKDKLKKILEILQEHVDAAVKRFEREGFTDKQAKAVEKNPGLEKPFTGERIDTFAKDSASKDPRLRDLGVEITKRFEKGADFKSGDRWWDITTESAWPAHEQRYGPGGIRLPY